MTATVGRTAIQSAAVLAVKRVARDLLALEGYFRLDAGIELDSGTTRAWLELENQPPQPRHRKDPPAP